MVTLRDTPPIEVQAARAVLLELAHLLGEYRQDVVLVGGWAPELLFPEAELTHVGSLDVDLALNHWTLDNASSDRRLRAHKHSQKVQQKDSNGASVWPGGVPDELFGSLSASRPCSNPRIIRWRARSLFREGPKACKSPEVNHSQHS